MSVRDDLPKGPLVSTDWLFRHLADPDLRVVDASWHLPNAGRNAEQEYAEAHIPGAVYFDLDRIADTSIPLPHPVAKPVHFAQEAGKLGLSERHVLVIYDSVGLFSAPRVWWNFRIMGARDVFVLDGGLPTWVAEGRPVRSGTEKIAPTTFSLDAQSGNVLDAAEVLQSLQDGSRQIVDVRPAGRFAGVDPEPRPGLRGGHMPGAKSMPFADFVANGRLKSPDDLRALFAAAGVSTSQPVGSSCGSGVTAPILNFALASLGIEEMHVYDGSWAEWGGRDDLPVVKDTE
ncbi:MAG: 3-mercaptopyruvate sulfurtransferase [Hyphomicrobiaceae bacterium]|nr:3-mercaptopyruvate sulfurtransferase [Hyphomicrobiaceae bacterium]